MLDLQQVKRALQQGEVIAYPTEAVFGLGCDPFNETAVKKILQLKNRSVKKGVILIAADYQQIKPFICEIDPIAMQNIIKTWPGAITWVFPASPLTPKWICGAHDTVAVRVTNHAIAQQICQVFNNPIVSTSANIEGQAPARSASEVEKIFSDDIDLIVTGEVGTNENPTEIRDAITGKILRSR